MNLTELTLLLDRGFEMLYRYLDIDTQNVLRFACSSLTRLCWQEATRLKLQPAFPWLDLKQTCAGTLLRVALYS